jgi:hypothetical protein
MSITYVALCNKPTTVTIMYNVFDKYYITEVAELCEILRIILITE